MEPSGRPPPPSASVSAPTSAPTSAPALPIAEDQIVELAETFRLMSDPTRLRIILACLRHPAAVGEMADRLGLSGSLVSHHLRLLRAARLLTAERRGRQVFYAVDDPHVRSMLNDMADHVAETESEILGPAGLEGGLLPP